MSCSEEPRARGRWGWKALAFRAWRDRCGDEAVELGVGLCVQRGPPVAHMAIERTHGFDQSGSLQGCKCALYLIACCSRKAQPPLGNAFAGVARPRVGANIRSQASCQRKVGFRFIRSRLDAVHARKKQYRCHVARARRPAFRRISLQGPEARAEFFVLPAGALTGRPRRPRVSSRRQDFFVPPVPQFVLARMYTFRLVPAADNQATPPRPAPAHHGGACPMPIGEPGGSPPSMFQ